MFENINPLDEAKIREQAEQMEKEQNEVASTFAATFSTESGKRCLKHLAVVCNRDTGCVRNPNNPNASSVLFESGKQAVYNYILFLLRHDNERRKRQ